MAGTVETEIYVLLFSIELEVPRKRNGAHERAKIKYTPPCTQAVHACVFAFVCSVYVCVCVAASV